jgi:hypothetical protein
VRSAAAARQHRCRARRRRGVALLRVEVDEFRLVDALLWAGRLNEAESRRRSLVEAAVAQVLKDFIVRWQK